MMYEMADETSDEAKIGRFRSIIREVEDEAIKQDKAENTSFSVYVYFAIADSKFGFGDFTHMAIAVVDDKTNEGLLISAGGGNSTSRYIMSPGNDPFVKKYNHKMKREVIRYHVVFPQDEANLVYRRSQNMLKRGLAFKPFQYMCGDNANDALSASKSYLFQVYQASLPAASEFGDQFFFVDWPYFVEGNYQDYFEASKGRGFIKARTHYLSSGAWSEKRMYGR